MTLDVQLWDDVLLPEEVELVEGYLRPGRRVDLDEPANVYVLVLASGAVYVGISKDVRNRVRAHARNALQTLASPEVAVEIPRDVQPSELFLAVHGEPALVAMVVCPTRRHALLHEATLTARLGDAGLHVYGAGFDQEAPCWTRNEVKGAKLAGPEAFAL